MKSRAPRRLGRSGQFMPISLMLIFTVVTLLWAVFDVYLVSKAKLKAQNIADAVALAIASLEARSINVVCDRNQWMNNLYPAGTKPTDQTLPGISAAHTDKGQRELNQTQAFSTYGNLVGEVNQAQQMFYNAYNQFIGAGGGTASEGSGAGSLIDILSQIDGIDSSVHVIVYNSANQEAAALSMAQQMAKQTASQLASVPPIQLANMAALNFITEPVVANNKPLSSSYAPGAPVGWMHVDWKNSSNTLNANVKKGQSQSVIGAGAIVIKQVNVSLLGAVIKQTSVQANAVAYVDQGSGLDIDPQSADPDKPDPAPNFLCTYYVQLAYQ